MAHYFLINKPYGMLSQFTREADHHRVLGDLYDFPDQVYPVGRLDRDSEGLLLLTDDRRVNSRLLDPTRGHHRTYWVQVEGVPDAGALNRLASGITIRVNKKNHHCRPVTANPLAPELVQSLPPRHPPVRYRASVPTSWWSLTLTEGKNRQVRRMWAAVGFPVLRLIRVAIDGLTIDALAGKSVVQLTAHDIGQKIPTLNL